MSRPHHFIFPTEQPSTTKRSPISNEDNSTILLRSPLHPSPSPARSRPGHHHPPSSPLIPAASAAGAFDNNSQSNPTSNNNNNSSSGISGNDPMKPHSHPHHHHPHHHNHHAHTHPKKLAHTRSHSSLYHLYIANNTKKQWHTHHTVMLALNSLLLLLMHRLLQITATNQRELFYIYYQPFAPFLSMLWFWGINVWFFERNNIRYDVCFSADEQKHLLPSTSIFDIANALSAVVLTSSCVFLFQCIQGFTEAAGVQPPLLYMGMLVILLLPITLFYQDTRRFFATTAWHIFTPIRSVSWADFLLADILTSLAKGISDVERAVCLMASGSVMSPAQGVCTDASWVIPAGLALPYFWRLCQCLRVHADTGARPQLWNALKYCTAFPVIALSAVKYHVTAEAWKAMYKPLWLAAALVNSAFSFFWDVERDWEISYFSQMKVQRTLLPTPVLQPALLFKPPVYWYLIASNAMLRLSWTYKLSPHLRRNHTTVLMIVLAEAFRRFQWIFVRVEVELRKIQAARGDDVGQLVPPVLASVTSSGHVIELPGGVIGGGFDEGSDSDSGGGGGGINGKSSRDGADVGSGGEEAIPLLKIEKLKMETSGNGNE